MNKNIKIYLPLLLSLFLVIGILIGNRIAKYSSSNQSLFLYPKSSKFNTVLKYIEEEYVDTVSANKLTESAIVAMLKDLDPHSLYIPAADLQETNEPIEGNFSGIGVQFNMQNDTVIIINTIANGPSALVGVMAGDRIVKVNDTTVAGVKLASDAIVKKLKGPRGTKVKVTIWRPVVKKELSFDITRDRIPLYSVDVAYMMNKTTGYVKINQFSKTTCDEFVSAANKLHEQGMKNIVVDLRGNGGGVLDDAICVADQFLGDGKLIVYTEGRSKPRENYFASSQGVCENDNVVIIIDEFSASASEILAGAIQDNDRGIIGRRSFGKGLVGEQIGLPDGSGLRLTIARYYTPTGRCIQKSYKNGVDDYYKDLNNRYEHGEFESKDSIKFNDSLKFTTPKGHVVYGGGGIMPDDFIPVDTTGASPFYNTIRDVGLIYRFAFEYSDKNRDKLKIFKNYKELVQALTSKNIMNEFVAYAQTKGIKASGNDLKISGKIIDVQLKAYIARNFFDNEGFYPIISEIDNTLDKAKSILK
jgi:carboxyl-terminal processing protease